MVLCGLQASGKSTFRRERFPEHVVVSKDLMSNRRNRERRQRRLVAGALAEGRSVVVDNTNPGPADREPLVAIGREFEATAVAYFFDVAFEVCRDRNAARIGRELVPYVGLVDVARRLLRPDPAEGFDEIWVVRANGCEFDVTPLASEGTDG